MYSQCDEKRVVGLTLYPNEEYSKAAYLGREPLF